MTWKDYCVEADPYYTLSEWKSFLDRVEKEYGKDIVLFTDAGANNVEMIVRVLKTSSTKSRGKKKV